MDRLLDGLLAGGYCGGLFLARILGFGVERLTDRQRRPQLDLPRLRVAERPVRRLVAVEAERAGLVSRLVPADSLIDEALAVAATIAGMSLSASRMAKEAVNRAFESSLAEGLLYERRLFHSAFATADQKPWALRKGWRASCSRRVMPSARMALIRAEKDLAE